MTRSCRVLLALAALSAWFGPAAAVAQTVVVRNAPPATAVEVTLNAGRVGTGTVNADGEATIDLDADPPVIRTDTDATVAVDICPDLRRVLIVERGQPGIPNQPGCDRQEIAGLYLVRRDTTLLVNLGGTAPSLMLLQRPLGSGPRVFSPAPSGLSVFGAGGLGRFAEARDLACGNVEPCTGGGYGAAYSVGVDFWLTRFAGVEAAFTRPLRSSVSGNGDGYRFTSDLDAHFLMVSGKGGIPIGPVRLYGRLGGNYHTAVTTMTQTNDEIIVEVGGVEQTIPGGEQINAYETKGWSWAFGGGIEVWVKPYLALVGDYGRTSVKGRTETEGAGSIDDRMTTILLGARVRIGGW